jgi:hypothetical protein
MEKITINNKEEARQYAIEWQKWASEQSLSYEELQNWNNYFMGLAGKWDLSEEFEENGII